MTSLMNMTYHKI